MRASLTVLSMIFAVATVDATQFEPFDRATQVRGSDVILLGRVAAVRSGWNDSRTAIFTETQIDVTEVWKGMPATDRVVVRVPGGNAGEIEQVVEGAARFETGELVVVFLEREAETYRPWGMAFGKYSLEGTGQDAFLVGGLPPVIRGAQAFDQVSVALVDLRREVDAILEGELLDGRLP